MSIFTLIALSLSMAVAVFNNGGVVLPEWNWCLIAIGGATVLHFSLCRRVPGSRLDRLSLGLIAILLVCASIQVVPLPVALIKVLSPGRFELIRGAEPVLGLPRFATLSIVPYATVQEVLNFAGYAATFFVIRDVSIRWRENPWGAVWPLVAIGGLEGALGLMQAYAEGSDGIAKGTYISRDHYTGLLEMVLPFAVMYPIAVLNRERSRNDSPAGPAIKACVVLLFGMMILIGTILSLSRMGFLASLGALFVCGALGVSLRGFESAITAEGPVRRRLIAVGVVGAVVLLGFVFLPTDPLVARFADLARTEDISADTRAQIWRDTMALIKAFPLFGCGLGGYESGLLRYKTVAPMFTVNYAHNDYLQFLAELGVFGFLAGVVFAGRVVMVALGRAVRSWQGDERFLMIACAGSLTAILLHSFVDFNLYMPANAMVLAWVCGIVMSGAGGTRARAKPIRN